MSSDTRSCPDGLAARHEETLGGLHPHLSILSLLVLGAIVLVALLGLLGGQRSPVMRAEGDAATLTVHTPTTLRSGLFFQTDVEVVAKRGIADVVIAVPPALWRDQTINTDIPAAGEEEFADGRFRFHYGALEAGKTMRVQIDGQVNPPLTLGTKGEIALLDGERPLASVPLSITVLP